MFIDISTELLDVFNRQEWTRHVCLQRAIININHIVAIEVRKDVHNGIISHHIKTRDTIYEITDDGFDLIIKLMKIHKLRMPDRR